MTFSSQLVALLDDVSNADVLQCDFSAAAAAAALGLASIDHDAYSQRARSPGIHLDCSLARTSVCCKFNRPQESVTGLHIVSLQTAAAHVEASIPVIRLN